MKKNSFFFWLNVKHLIDRCALIINIFAEHSRELRTFSCAATALERYCLLLTEKWEAAEPQKVARS
jgi:hypothetical protein